MHFIFFKKAIYASPQDVTKTFTYLILLYIYLALSYKKNYIMNSFFYLVKKR